MAIPTLSLSKCTKDGLPGVRCGGQCLWMCTDPGPDKENPLPARFVKCRFLDL